MTKIAILMAIGLGLAGCGDVDRQPITKQQAVRMCHQKVTEAHHVERFDPTVSANYEDGLWEIRGNALQPNGDYHCTIVAASGEIGVVGFARYKEAP